jgi:hypothetical protein
MYIYIYIYINIYIKYNRSNRLIMVICYNILIIKCYQVHSLPFPLTDSIPSKFPNVPKEMMNQRVHPDGTEANDPWIFQKGRSFQTVNRTIEQEHKKSFYSYQESNHRIPSTPTYPQEMKSTPLITETQFLEHYQHSRVPRRSLVKLAPYTSSNLGIPYPDSHLDIKFLNNYIPYNPGQLQHEIHEHVQPLCYSSHDFYELRKILSFTDDQMDLPYKTKLESNFLTVKYRIFYFSVLIFFD